MIWYLNPVGCHDYKALSKSPVAMQLYVAAAACSTHTAEPFIYCQNEASTAMEANSLASSLVLLMLTHIFPAFLAAQSLNQSARRPSHSMKINYGRCVSRVAGVMRCAAWWGGGASFSSPSHFLRIPVTLFQRGPHSQNAFQHSRRWRQTTNKCRQNMDNLIILFVEFAPDSYLLAPHC